MRLTNFSDYALRILMFAASQDQRLVTIEEAAAIYGISRTHLTKVVNQLTRSGFLRAVRGRTGGLTLGMRPETMRLGDIVRATEPDFALVECFGNANHCLIAPRCRLKAVLGSALSSFLEVLDRHTLADILLAPEDFGLPPAA